MKDSVSHQPLAYLDGRWIPAEQAAVPVSDLGFLLGTTVSERMRTFGGELFRLEAHLARLAGSAEIVGIEIAVKLPELREIAGELVRSNHRLLAAGDDLALAIFVTPGDAATLDAPPNPRIGMHTFPLPFGQWSAKYAAGEALAISSVEQISPRSWPAGLKCRSRMHYYLADTAAARRQPPARALLLSREGLVTETSTANIVAFIRGEGLVTPPRPQVLPGISLACVAELASALGMVLAERAMTPTDLSAAEEILLTSTPWCILPVTNLDGRRVGQGLPGPVFRQLIDAWSRLVGVDVVAQAAQFSAR